MRVLAVLLLLCFPSATSAQQSSCPPGDGRSGTGAILGRTADRETGVALGFTRVLLQGEGLMDAREERASPTGSFQFCAVPEGTYRVSAQLGDWVGSVLGVRVTAGAETSLTLELGPISLEPTTGTLTGIVVDGATGAPTENALSLAEAGRILGAAGPTPSIHGPIPTRLPSRRRPTP